MARKRVGPCPDCGKGLRVRVGAVKAQMHLTCRCGWQGMVSPDTSLIDDRPIERLETGPKVSLSNVLLICLSPALFGAILGGGLAALGYIEPIWPLSEGESTLKRVKAGWLAGLWFSFLFAIYHWAPPPSTHRIYFQPVQKGETGLEWLHSFLALIFGPTTVTAWIAYCSCWLPAGMHETTAAAIFGACVMEVIAIVLVAICASRPRA